MEFSSHKISTHLTVSESKPRVHDSGSMVQGTEAVAARAVGRCIVSCQKNELVCLLTAKRNR
jgi:hypothetical protein